MPACGPPPLTLPLPRTHTHALPTQEEQSGLGPLLRCLPGLENFGDNLRAKQLRRHGGGGGAAEVAATGLHRQLMAAVAADGELHTQATDAFRWV